MGKNIEEQMEILKISINLLEKRVATLEGQVQEQPSVTVDFQETNLKKLTITNDKNIYEDMKSNKSVGILFDPVAFKQCGFNDNDGIYIIGILQDK